MSCCIWYFTRAGIRFYISHFSLFLQEANPVCPISILSLLVISFQVVCVGSRLCAKCEQFLASLRPCFKPIGLVLNREPCVACDWEGSLLPWPLEAATLRACSRSFTWGPWRAYLCSCLWRKVLPLPCF